MLHTKSDRSHLLKLLALLPIVGIALAVNAEKVVDVRYDELQKQKEKKVVYGTWTPQAGTNSETRDTFAVALSYDTIPGETYTAVGTYEPVQGDVFDVVEEMPQYPGGPQALFKFLSENVKYPAEAEKAGIQGRVIATFVVEKDGSISQPIVVKSVDPLLDAEAIRVISAMPNWIPGKQNGKVVRVKYTVPLSFNLDGGGEEIDHLCREDGTIVEIDIEKGDTAIVRPLFIVDGKVMDGKKVYSINPKTIERYYMQNGQEAIDKYGDKAKDGVILITLKKDN
jgi:TonB family protein